jgi:peroxiredoxin
VTFAMSGRPGARPAPFARFAPLVSQGAPRCAREGACRDDLVTARPRARSRAAAVPALALAAALALAGCAAESGATSSDDDVVGQGYVSGDGSVRTWEPDDRGEPVALTGTDYEGEAVDTAAWRGDVVVLNTWYAACAPCRAEAPDLVALARDRADDGVRLLGINTTDEPGAAQAFQRTFEVPYPSLDDRSGEVVAALSGTVPLQAVPSTVVLDREGRVAARVIGLAEGSTLTALVDDVLGEDAAAGGATG